jgi:hypothetical protein
MNTIATRVYRDKYRAATLDTLLRSAVVAEKICMVDRTDAKRIQSPYGSQPTTTVQTIAGTYTPAAYTTTDDTLTVTDEFIVAEHIYDFEEVLTALPIFASRVKEMGFSVANKIDEFVLNNLCEDGTGTYTTATGGFTTPANITKIMADLQGKIAGYSDQYKGTYLVIENTDVTGFAQAQAANGFSFADAALKNGFFTNYMGTNIYVVRTGLFKDDTIGTTTFTNDGHRVFGVNKVTTYAHPRGVRFEEKSVTGKTGKEVVAWGYIGFKAWAPKAALTIDITLA